MPTRWVGHVIRMDQVRLPKSVMYGELQRGKRRVGRPRLRFIDCIKRHLGSDIPNWEECVKDRSPLRGFVNKNAVAVDARLETQTAERSRRRANRNSSTTPTNPQLTCRKCGRMCRARIGLLSHEKSCQRHTLIE